MAAFFWAAPFSKLFLSKVVHHGVKVSARRHRLCKAMGLKPMGVRRTIAPRELLPAGSLASRTAGCVSGVLAVLLAPAFCQLPAGAPHRVQTVCQG